MKLFPETLRIKNNRKTQIKYRDMCRGVGYDTTFKYEVAQMIKAGLDPATEQLDELTTIKLVSMVEDAGINIQSIRNWAMWFAGVVYFKMMPRDQITSLNTLNLRTDDYCGMGIRSLIVGTTIWFVGADIATLLGYSNISFVNQELEPKHKEKIKLYGRGAHACIVSLPGLRRLYMKHRNNARNNKLQMFYPWLNDTLVPKIVQDEIERHKSVAIEKEKNLLNENIEAVYAFGKQVNAVC